MTKEIKCPHCGGLIPGCTLCNGLGIVKEPIEGENYRIVGWKTVPCPNGCKSQEEKK